MAAPRDSVTGLQKPTTGADRNTWGAILNRNWDVVNNVMKGIKLIAPNLTSGAWKIGGTAVTATGDEINRLGGVTSAVQTQLDEVKKTADAGTDLDEAVTKAGLTAVEDDILVKGASGWEIRHKATEAEVTADQPSDEVKSITSLLLDRAIKAKATFDAARPYSFQLREPQGVNNKVGITTKYPRSGETLFITTDTWFAHKFNWVTDATDDSSFFQPGQNNRTTAYNSGPVHINTDDGSISLGPGKYYIEAIVSFWSDGKHLSLRARIFNKTDTRTISDSLTFWCKEGSSNDCATHFIPASGYFTVPKGPKMKITVETYAKNHGNTGAINSCWGKANDIAGQDELYTTATVWKLGI